MLDRSMTGDMLTDLARAQQRTGHLYELYLDSGTVYGTDIFVPIVWNGNTYLALGHHVGYAGVDENVELRVQKGSITLSGVDQSYISIVLSEDIARRRAVIRRVNLTSAWAAIVDPSPVRDGLMDVAAIETDEDSGKCVVMVEVTNHPVDFDRKPGRHTNDEEQRLWYPDDGIFKYVNQIEVRKVWRGA